MYSLGISVRRSKNLFQRSLGTGNFYERSSSQMSCCRAHHSAVNWNNTYIVVFGGAGTNNQVEMFNVAEDFWEVVPTWGNAPSGRYGHAAALVEDTMFIFGGVDADTKQVLNDFWALNLNTFAWTQLEFPFGPTVMFILVLDILH